MPNPIVPQILDVSRQFIEARVVLTGAELDVFTLLAGEGLTAEQVTGRLGGDGRGVTALLDALTAGSLHCGSRTGDERQSAVWVAGVSAESGGDVRGADQAQERDGGVAQGSHDLRRGPAADLAAVLVEGHVSHPMQTVLDPPMSSRQLEQALRARLVRRKTGDQIVRLLPADSAPGDAGDQTGHLGQMRPLRPLVQRRRSSELADLVPVTALPSRPQAGGRSPRPPRGCCQRHVGRRWLPPGTFPREARTRACPPVCP